MKQLRNTGQNVSSFLFFISEIIYFCCQGKEDTRVTFEQFLPMLQTVSSRPIMDTVDDFVEGLRHFDKVRLCSTTVYITK
jgi:hypothetical protein